MLSKTICLALYLALISPALASPVSPHQDVGGLFPYPKRVPAPVPAPDIPVPVPVWRRIDDVVVAVPRQTSAVSSVPSVTVSSAMTLPTSATVSPTSSSVPATAVSAVEGSLASSEAEVHTNTETVGIWGGDTENDLLDGTGCKDNLVIFARGTTETGNVGTLTGPPFFAALAQKVGEENLAVQGVDYPADIPGFLAGGSSAGSQTMAALVQQAVSQCPKTQVVISGYSQGAQLVHNAAAMLPASVMDKVAGAVLFGDPDDGTAVQGVSSAQTLVICHPGDLICAHTAIVEPQHLTYSENAVQAANFAASL
ncbi:hypothetical protein N0V82_004067 [Gnomoniopsis sp. IMI 355080]|nr:hypothetical protein N0V82_004067 [Gnomoniopsis sp. IMI 355080]